MSDKPFGLIVVFRTDAADTPISAHVYLAPVPTDASQFPAPVPTDAEEVQEEIPQTRLVAILEQQTKEGV